MYPLSSDPCCCTVSCLHAESNSEQNAGSDGLEKSFWQENEGEIEEEGKLSAEKAIRKLFQ